MLGEVRLNLSEVEWFLRNVNFSKNQRLYNKLLKHTRRYEVLLGEKVWLIDCLTRKPQILETHEWPAEVFESTHFQVLPKHGFLTKEQYFTDPSQKRIHFSEHGFLVLTDFKSVFLINRETGEFTNTSYRHFKADEGEIDLDGEPSFLRIQSEFYWRETDEERALSERLRQAREELEATPVEKICPVCFSEKLVEVGEDHYGCPICEESLELRDFGFFRSSKRV